MRRPCNTYADNLGWETVISRAIGARLSVHRRKLLGNALLLACVCGTLIGCMPNQVGQANSSLRADFNVAVANDGETVVWWLRMSGRCFAEIVHKSAARPQFGSTDNLTHEAINTLIAVGLEQHGLSRCPPIYRTVAVMKNGAIQFTGTCVPATNVAVSVGGNGS